MMGGTGPRFFARAGPFARQHDITRPMRNLVATGHGDEIAPYTEKLLPPDGLAAPT